MSKNDHMLAILWLLSSGKTWTAKQLSEKLEVHIRSIYRYIDSLCISGVPIVAHAGHNGGYSLLNHFVNTPLVFDMDEQKALMHAAVFAKEAGYPFDDALQRATDKLALYSNQEQAELLNRYSDGINVIARTTPAAVKQSMIVLEQAVAEQYAVNIEYRKPKNDQLEQRTINPYSMINWNNKWYVIGFCQLRQDVRSFRIERIASLSTTATAFERPQNFSARQFFLSPLLPESANSHSSISLIVEGRSEALDDLCMHWFLGHYLRERTPTLATFILDEQTMHAYVPYYLLSYGKAIKVLEPLSLKQKLVDVANNLMKHYEG